MVSNPDLYQELIGLGDFESRLLSTFTWLDQGQLKVAKRQDFEVVLTDVCEMMELALTQLMDVSSHFRSATQSMFERVLDLTNQCEEAKLRETTLTQEVNKYKKFEDEYLKAQKHANESEQKNKSHLESAKLSALLLKDTRKNGYLDKFTPESSHYHPRSPPKTTHSHSSPIPQPSNTKKNSGLTESVSHGSEPAEPPSRPLSAPSTRPYSGRTYQFRSPSDAAAAETRPQSAVIRSPQDLANSTGPSYMRPPPSRRPQTASNRLKGRNRGWNGSAVPAGPAIPPSRNSSGLSGPKINPNKFKPKSSKRASPYAVCPVPAGTLRPRQETVVKYLQGQTHLTKLAEGLLQGVKPQGHWGTGRRSSAATARDRASSNNPNNPSLDYPKKTDNPQEALVLIRKKLNGVAYGTFIFFLYCRVENCFI